MKKLLAGCLMLITCLSAGAQKQKDIGDQLKGIDTAFARVLKSTHAVGFAVAVVSKDKVIYSKGFGYSDIATKTPVTPNTVFAIGSCTKAFTASLVGWLNKDGKVDYDKPVREYLPAVKFYSTELNNTITLRDMMCHRTGLPRHDLSWYLFATHNRDSLVQRIQYMEPSATLRQRWQYNNFMFLLQGALVEKLTGKSWEDNIKEKFIDPLGMSRTTTGYTEWMKTGDIATGYSWANDSVLKLRYYDIAAMAPAGSINSTVGDMAKWVITWINGGKYNGKEIIPSGYAAEAVSSQMVIDGALPSKEAPDVFLANYGFGWFLSSYRGHYRVEHGGNINGFSANTSFFPSDSIGIVVLCNQNASVVPSLVRNLVADRLLGLKYKDWTTLQARKLHGDEQAAKEMLKKRVKDSAAKFPASHPLSAYAGAFENKGYGTMHIELMHDSLLVHMGGGEVYFRHKTYDLFEAFVKSDAGYDTINATIARFHMNDVGEIDEFSADLENGVKAIVFERINEPQPIAKDSLKKYVGTYEIAPNVAAKIYIKSDSVLYLFVPGQPEYELVPVKENNFNIKNLSGYSIRFNVNAAGKVTEVLFNQPNGTFKARRKDE